MKQPYDFKILIACEESQAVCKAFLELGFNAWSCDLKPCSGGRPDRHIQGDCLEVMQNSHWDLVIAHPPCTFLAVCGNRWFTNNPKRCADRKEAQDFFMKLVDYPNVEHIAIENPIGVMSSYYRKPDQIVQPFYFGDPYSKKTCLWLRGLPLLKPTNIVDKGEIIHYASGRNMPAWYAKLWSLPKEERQTIRSKTFPGLAQAMAEQWGNYLLNEDQKGTK